MKVIANPTILDAVVWDGTEITFKKIKELADNYEDKTYMRDGQLIVYNHVFEDEEVVEIGDFLVFETIHIEICSPIAFDAMYQEWEEE